MSRVVFMAGTRKGAFFLDSTPDRTDWTVRGPRLKGWEVSDLCFDDRVGGVDSDGGADSGGHTSGCCPMGPWWSAARSRMSAWRTAARWSCCRPCRVGKGVRMEWSS